jgi:2-keto-3-deoxy-L-rhamnonate aldolase RhmA
MSRGSGLKARLSAGELLVGSFVNAGSTVTAEIMGHAGFDWLAVDLEHGAGDEHVLLTQLQALAHTSCVPLVRVESGDQARIAHALDLGAGGILAPRLRTVAESQTVAASCRYSGRRGIARYNRSWRWGLEQQSLEDVDATVVCGIQIETGEALDAVDAIAALDGVDILFVGPADLGHALGIGGNADSPELLAHAARVANAARAHSKTAGVLVGTAQQAARYRDLGFTFLGCGSDTSILASSATQLANDIRTLAPNEATNAETAGLPR